METMLEYKCPSCGGALRFDSGLQKMKCPYCDTEFEVEALKTLEETQQQQSADDMAWQTGEGSQWQEEDAVTAYSCQSCGGEIMADASTAATSCPYCGNPVVMLKRVTGDLRPDCMIPFKLDKKAAVAALQKHMTGKPLLPKVFKDENHIKQIKGVYVPFWLFDAHAEGSARYHATRVRMWSDSDYNYTETKHYSIHRAGNLDFKGVPVDGSSKMANDLMESLEPYDLSEAVDFQTAYLAGYLADKYDVAAEDSVPRANERIKSSTEQSLRDTVVGYSSVRPEHNSVRLSDNSSRYALYPVWLLHTNYRGTDYLFAMNGQTGKLVGDLPMDKAAYWKWWAGMFAAGTAVATLLAWIAGFL